MSRNHTVAFYFYFIFLGGSGSYANSNRRWCKLAVALLSTFRGNRPWNRRHEPNHDSLGDALPLGSRQPCQRVSAVRIFSQYLPSWVAMMIVYNPAVGCAKEITEIGMSSGVPGSSYWKTPEVVKGDEFRSRTPLLLPPQKNDWNCMFVVTVSE